MDTVKGVLLILTILFGSISFLLFIQYSAATVQVAQATELGGNLLALLKAEGAVNCGSLPTNFNQMNTCIKPLLLVKDFKEDSFSQPDPKKGLGYLVIKNINHKTYDSDRFEFYVNRNLMQSGCTISGTIDYNVACRFNFPEVCEDGTVLEVKYNLSSTNETVKVFTKNC